METENKCPYYIPYYVLESEQTRMEIVNRRLSITLIITLLALIGTNAAWIIHLFF